MNPGIGRHVRIAILVAAPVIIVAVFGLAVFASSQETSPPLGPPPVTPPPVPTPTPPILGVPTDLSAVPSSDAGEVFLFWKPAQNATVHWIWSAKWDNTDGKWSAGANGLGLVGDLEVGQDYWFAVIAGMRLWNGEYQWSRWSNWAKATPNTIPAPTPTPEVRIPDIPITIVEGPDGPEAFAGTPCDGPTATVVPEVHGGGSPTGLSCGSDDGANFNLTPLVSEGHGFTIQLACLHFDLIDCALMSGQLNDEIDIGFVDRVHRRTNGQVRFKVRTFDDVGLDGHEALARLDEGTLESVQIHPEYAGHEHPVVDIVNLSGIYRDQGAALDVIEVLQPKFAELTAEYGGVQIAYMTIGNDYLYARRAVHDDPESFQGFPVRAFTDAQRDLLDGLGADPRDVPFADVHEALGRGDIEGALSCVACGYEEGWHHVADYIAGPLYSARHSWLAINETVWDSMPNDLQNIIMEEGARHAYLNRHLVFRFFEPHVLEESRSHGLVASQFSEPIEEAMRHSAIVNVLPNWVRRIGGPHSEAVHVFNELVYPIVGMYINPDGSAAVE